MVLGAVHVVTVKQRTRQRGEIKIKTTQLELGLRGTNSGSQREVVAQAAAQQVCAQAQCGAADLWPQTAAEIQGSKQMFVRRAGIAQNLRVREVQRAGRV